MYGLNRLTYTRKRYALLHPTFCEIYQISDADLVAINAHNFGFLSQNRLQNYYLIAYNGFKNH